MDRTFRILLSMFVIVAAVLIGLIVVSIANTKRAIHSADWVNHTHAYIAEVDATIGSLREAEGAINAFLLAGDPISQANYRRSFAELAEHIEIAKALVGADSAEVTALTELETLLQLRTDRARSLLSAQKAEDSATVQSILVAADEDLSLVNIRRAAQHIRSRQTQLLTERDQTSYRQDQVARNTLYLGGFFNTLMLIGAAWFVRDDLTNRRRATRILAQANQDLEIKVSERTADLVASDKKLRAENLESRWTNQALEHQLRYNNLIINSLSEPILVITKALNISRVNPATLRATGADTSDLVDRPLTDFVTLDIDPTSTPAPLDPFTESLRFGFDLRHSKATLSLPGATPRSVLLSLFPLRDRDRVVGGIVTLHIAPSDPL